MLRVGKHNGLGKRASPADWLSRCLYQVISGVSMLGQRFRKAT